MAISVNTSDSLYSQVIQSAQNRRRVSEQSGQDPGSSQQPKQAAASADGARAASGADYERAYEQARDSLRMPNATSPQAAAYANVQQLGQRDELQGMLAFSAYA